MKNKLAINLGKLASKASQTLGKGEGNTIAGKVARLIDKGILKDLSQQVENVIFVTGTNGKTTVSNLLADILKADGKRLIHNAAGDNLMPGITSCFLANAGANGTLDYEWAVIEVDESTLIRAVEEITPRAIVLNNFSKDQLDRIGSLDRLLSRMKNAIEPLETHLFLNADDPLSSHFASLGKPTTYFGLQADSYEFERFDNKESKLCPSCFRPLTYAHTHYAQLGHFSCECGFARGTVTYEVASVDTTEGLSFRLDGTTYDMALTGAYNVYNALAALSVADTFGIQQDAIKEGLKRYKPDNGRMQRFNIDEHIRLMNLVKNPAGVNSTLSEVLSKPNEKQIVLFLNDYESDGVDISWIYEADFERLHREDVKTIVCSGTRAHDLMVRLKYAGIEEDRLVFAPLPDEAIRLSLKEEIDTYYLPNYTAMAGVRRFLLSKEKK